MYTLIAEMSVEQTERSKENPGMKLWSWLAGLCSVPMSDEIEPFQSEDSNTNNHVTGQIDWEQAKAHSKTAEVGKIKVEIVRSPESTVFHKAVAELEVLQYKSADIKTREDSQRVREMSGYIIRCSHERTEAKREKEEQSWEREAQISDKNTMWEKAREAARLLGHQEREQEREKEREQDREKEKDREKEREKEREREQEYQTREQAWDRENNVFGEFIDRKTRQSRRSMGQIGHVGQQSRLSVETHVSPRSHCHKHKHHRRHVCVQHGRQRSSSESQCVQQIGGERHSVTRTIPV